MTKNEYFQDRRQGSLFKLIFIKNDYVLCIRMEKSQACEKMLKLNYLLLVESQLWRLYLDQSFGEYRTHFGSILSGRLSIERLKFKKGKV